MDEGDRGGEDLGTRAAAVVDAVVDAVVGNVTTALSDLLAVHSTPSNASSAVSRQ